MLAGDFPLETVDRRERFALFRTPRGLLPKGVTTLLDQELRSSNEVGDAMQRGDDIPLYPSGGVRSSSARGDAVDTDVREVGCSIAEVVRRSSSGLVGSAARGLCWLWYLLGLEPQAAYFGGEASSSSCDKAFLNPELRGWKR